MPDFKDRRSAGVMVSQAILIFVLGLSCLILLGLSYYSIRYTQVSTNMTEIFIPKKDSFLWNILSLLIAFLLSSALCVYLRNKCTKSRVGSRILLAAVLILSFSISICWLNIAHIKPEGDQLMVYALAGYVWQGDVSPLKDGAYLNMYPQQFGLVAILGVLYRIFGVMNYQAFEYLNTICVPLLIFSGFKITRLIDQREESGDIYLLLSIFYIPMYLYVPYIYGEVGSLALSAVVVWQILEFCKSHKWYFIVTSSVSAAIAYQFRMNIIIVVIAVGIVLCVDLIKNKKWLSAVMIISLGICIFGTNLLIHEYYENKAGLDCIKGLPRSLHISMGLQDNALGPGWYNGYGERVFTENGFSIELSDMVGKQDIKLRLKEFSDDKQMMFDFYKRKILSQWNEPTCDSLVLTNSFEEDGHEVGPLILRIYRGNLNAPIVDFMDRYQTVLFVFSLIAGVSFLHKRKEDGCLLLFLIFLGGFSFSVLWEAKSRYVLPYLFYLIPLVAVGIRSCAAGTERLFDKRKNKVLSK